MPKCMLEKPHAIVDLNSSDYNFCWLTAFITSFTSTFFIKIFFLLLCQTGEWERSCSLLLIEMFTTTSLNELHNCRWYVYQKLVLEKGTCLQFIKSLKIIFHLRMIWKALTRVNWGLMNVFSTSHQRCIRRRVYSFLILFVDRKLQQFLTLRKVSFYYHHLSCFGTFFEIYFA